MRRLVIYNITNSVHAFKLLETIVAARGLYQNAQSGHNIWTSFAQTMEGKENVWDWFDIFQVSHVNIVCTTQKQNLVFLFLIIFPDIYLKIAMQNINKISNEWAYGDDCT